MCVGFPPSCGVAAGHPPSPFFLSLFQSTFTVHNIKGLFLFLSFSFFLLREWVVGNKMGTFYLSTT